MVPAERVTVIKGCALPIVLAHADGQKPLARGYLNFEISNKFNLFDILKIVIFSTLA